MTSIKKFNDFRDDQEKLSILRKYTKDSTVLTYFIVVHPLASREELIEPLEGLIDWCVNQAQQGNEILITARDVER